MHIKHTFLITFLLGVVWTGCLFAFSLGPPPAVNGINENSHTCAGCHSSFPFNDPSGSVSVLGLPSDGWGLFSAEAKLRLGFSFPPSLIQPISKPVPLQAARLSR